MSFDDEFAVVDMIVSSKYETRGIDSFSLAVIKAERQMRKLFTHLVFQYPCFDAASAYLMREALGEGNAYYFEGFERGINAVAPVTVAAMIGGDYATLRAALAEATQIRNKIFHGQLTQNGYVSREELLERVATIKRWCKLLADAGLREFGYDGFMRESFRKGRPDLASTYRVEINSIEDYKRFLADHVARPRGARSSRQTLQPTG